MIKLFRTSSFYRPLSVMVSKKDYELDNIIFFNENGVITQIGRGFFDDDLEREFLGTCVRKLKVDFNMKDNFVVKSNKDYFNEVRYNLYVYEKNAKVEYLGKEQKYFGEIYSHWKVDNYEFWNYEKSLKNKLCNINDKAEEKIKKLLENFGYMGKGVDEKILSKDLLEIKKLNKQILEEVKVIENYEIDE